MAAQLRAAQRASDEAWGRDESEQVRVALASDGRIASVEVGEGWRAALGADGLTAAVLAGYREAGNRRVEAWAAEISRAEPAADDVAASDAGLVRAASTDVEQPSGGGPLEPVAQDAIRQLWVVLQDAGDRLDELADELDGRRRATVSGRDGGHHVTATLTGAELTGLDLEPRWLAEGTSGQIGAAITEAIAAGYTAADRLAEDSLARRWPFADLERLTADPARLLHSLGLPTTPSVDLRGGDR